MNYKKGVFTVIVLIFTFGLGTWLAYHSSFLALEIVGVDLDAQPSMLAVVILIAFLIAWYSVFCFVGLILGLIAPRPICGAAVLSVLNSNGSFRVPFFTTVYNYVVRKLYQGGRH